MPITFEGIQEANRRMLGKTNRTLLFARVNMDAWLDPDASEENRESTPSLADMLAHIDNVSDEQFLTQVREELTVTSFQEFLDKFQPGFYYRVMPQASPPEYADATEVDGEDDEALRNAGGLSVPRLEFSLIGGPGWKKISITADHPYIRCLSTLINKRVRLDVSSFRVDVDASLFAFKPKNQRALMRKTAEDVQAKNDRLMLEAKRNPASRDTARALDAYQAAAHELQAALEDALRVLPTITYGLEKTASELKRGSDGGGVVDPNVYQIEFGKNRSLIASPRQLPMLTLPPQRSPTDAEATADELESDRALDGGKSLVRQSSPSDALTVRPVQQALDRIREESKHAAQADLSHVPVEKRFPITLGKFMDKMISRNLIAPLMGNLLAVVLQNPKELALLSPDVREIEAYHDMFLGMYSDAVDAFLRTVTPLFETIMGVYLLFNEFPADVRLPEGMKPELIIANADLADIFLTRAEELKRFFDISNAQATNQFRDAISFVIVPHVAEFRKRRPLKNRTAETIHIDEDLLNRIREAQTQVDVDEARYDRVTFVDEMLPLLEWGHAHGFMVLFSPEERVRAGRTSRDFFQTLTDAYAVDQIVERMEAECGVLCLPDFVIMPPDGKLITGRTADGAIEVGVDVPELDVRACFVTAGRLMANDVPAYLQRKMLQARKDPGLVSMELPGIGLDLSVHPYLGETNLPTDHFLNDGVLANLLNPNMPFLVFTHVSGRAPFLSVARTMRRTYFADGTIGYRPLHLVRQQTYLTRLLRAAHELGLGGAFPSDDKEAESFLSGMLDYLIKFSGWYDPERYVNTFPSKLDEKQLFRVERHEGNTFMLTLNFERCPVEMYDIRF